MFSIRLRRKQWDRLSDIIGSAGHISIASVVIPYLFDKYDLGIALLGTILAFIFWVTSVIISKRA